MTPRIATLLDSVDLSEKIDLPDMPQKEYCAGILNNTGKKLLHLKIKAHNRVAVLQYKHKCSQATKMELEQAKKDMDEIDDAFWKEVSKEFPNLYGEYVGICKGYQVTSSHAPKKPKLWKMFLGVKEVLKEI